jgi:hypothetical protein
MLATIAEVPPVVCVANLTYPFLPHILTPLSQVFISLDLNGRFFFPSSLSAIEPDSASKH